MGWRLVGKWSVGLQSSLSVLTESSVANILGLLPCLLHWDGVLVGKWLVFSPPYLFFGAV
jgi:hypothetical protein